MGVGLDDYQDGLQRCLDRLAAESESKNLPTVLSVDCDLDLGREDMARTYFFLTYSLRS
jgi:hypothetical protein